MAAGGSHLFVSGSFFGFEFEYTYFAHIQDYKISLNPDLPEDVVVLMIRLKKQNPKKRIKHFRKKTLTRPLLPWPPAKTSAVRNCGNS